MRNFCATLYATPPGFAFVFVAFSRGLGLRVFAFYALTGRPLRGSTVGLLYSAPPGLKFRLPSSLLRSYAEAGAYARNPPFKFRFIGLYENRCKMKRREMLKKAGAE